MRSRHRAQVSVIALFAMLVLTGALALVVDAGVFFVTQRQLQTAADAAALAAAWYAPVCDVGNTDPYVAAHCNQGIPPTPTWPSGCSGLPSPYLAADKVADTVALANLGYIGALCRTACPAPVTVAAPRTFASVFPTGSPPGSPQLTFYIMTLECDAPYWFARIFPSIPAVIHIRATATSVWGYRTPDGDVTGTIPSPLQVPPFVTRLTVR